MPMLIHTTCASCGDTLTVQRPGHDIHPDCPPPTDLVSVATRDYMAAVMGDGGGAMEAEILQLEQRLDRYGHTPPRLLDAALTYAGWGWPVFPCRPQLKVPTTPHGFRDATCDAERIRDWWWRWPAANIGVATGHAFDVIDVDPDGLAWWSAIRDHDGLAGHLPDCHGQVATPRAGLHVYIGPMGGGNLAGLADGIDYRGLGGYILAPPSVLGPHAYPTPPNGTRLTYAWNTYPSPAIKPAIKPGLREVR